MRKKQSGYTLLEIMLVVSVIAVIILAITQFVFPISKFIQRGRVRQQTTAEARICLETIQGVIVQGRASTLIISNSPTTPPMPGGQVAFQGVDGSSYTITWSTTPLNSVHLQKTLAGGTSTTDNVLASHVAQLSFSWDMNDPTIVMLFLQMKIALDQSGSSDGVLTIDFPSQILRMIGS